MAPVMRSPSLLVSGDPLSGQDLAGSQRAPSSLCVYWPADDDDDDSAGGI